MTLDRRDARRLLVVGVIIPTPATFCSSPCYMEIPVLTLRTLARLFMVALACLSIWLLKVPPAGFSDLQVQTLVIVMLTLGLLVTGVLPGYLVALLLFLACVLLDVAPAQAVFSGFYSGAFWLIVAGMVIGMAIKSTGLGSRLAGVIGRHLEHSYAWLVGGLMLVSTLLGFVMPSSIGRVVMMVPIALALADRCGFVSGSKGRTGLALTVAFGCHVPTFAILPSNIPNMVLIGAADTIHGLHLSYTHYLLLHFPVLGILKGILISLLIIRLYPDRPRPVPVESAAPAVAAGSNGEQLRLGVILFAALAFWMTDSWHGISPAWIGLGAACVLLMPRIGLVDSKRFAAGMDFTLLLFLAGILGLGQIVATTGLGSQLAAHLEQWLPLAPGDDFLNFVSLSLMAFLAALVTTLPGVPAVMTPMAADLASQSGLALETVLMTQVIGFSTILFPYQSGPLLVGMQLAKEPISHLLRITLPLALLTLLVLLPLDYLWWQLLGQF